MRKRHRVVVTGLGAVTCIGLGKEGLWRGLRAAVSGIRRITRFDASKLDGQVAGQIDDFDPLQFFNARRLKRLDRYAQFALCSAKMAVSDAGLVLRADHTRHDIGICFGSALGGTPSAEPQHEIFIRQGLRAVNPTIAVAVFGGAGASNIAIEFGCAGPCNANANSCASGAIAIGEAFHLIRDGRAAAMIAGGAEAPLFPLTFGAFDLIHSMSTRNDAPQKSCCPFNRDRDGFVMGEGAASLILESLDHARARGASIYAELLGYALNNDAHHMVTPRPDGDCAARCMAAALADAQIAPGKIDFVSAHGSSTPLGDKAETLATKKIFANRAREIPISATKAMHAHALGASGAIEAAVCALALERDWLPPTINLQNADPDCDLDFIPNVGRAARVNFVLSNSFGFGGVNACLVLGRHA